MEDTKLIAKKRDLQGSSNSRRLRKTGNLPAVIYGEGKDATAIQLETHAFEQLLHHHASETILVEIELEGEGVISALVKDVQHHPVSSDLVHVDLQKVIAGKLMQVDIAVELNGEAAGVKAGGTLDHVMHSITVECFPRHIVESVEIDVSEMEIGTALYVSDLDLGADFKVLADAEAIVASVAEPRVEEEEEAEEGVSADAADAEPEVINEKKADEGAE
jgi:large subunit ribosomal protein L25